MSNVVVVDTSIAIKWVLHESDTPTAEALLEEWNSKQIKIFAPSLLIYEVTNALYQKARRGEINLERVKEALSAMTFMGITFELSANFALSTQAAELASRFSLPATYDAHYLALAENRGCELWTADTRMWNSLQGKLVWVRWLSDFSTSS